MTGTVEHEPTSTSDTNFNNTTSINDEESPKRQFRFDVDGRVLAIPLMGVATGFSIGTFSLFLRIKWFFYSKVLFLYFWNSLKLY